MGAEGLSRVPSPKEDRTAEAAPARRGRPPHRPTGETRRQVEAMAALFLSQENMGAILGVSDDTLRRHYPAELARGVAQGQHGIASGLHRLMEKGNAAAQIHMAKAKLGWSEKLKVEHAASSSGGGDAVRRYLAVPEEERLPRLRALAARILAPAPDSEADGFERE
jgi:hypothetical protein